MFSVHAWRAAPCLLDCYMKIYPENIAASPRSQVEEPPFRTLHELAELLEALGQHFHTENRLALGESGYYCQLAETLQKLGRLATLPVEFPAVDEEFRNAYPPGTLAHEEQTRRFLSLVGSQFNDTTCE